MKPTKDQLEALRRLMGTTSMNVPVGDKVVAVNMGAVVDLALRQLVKDKPVSRRVRFANAAEVTLWQRKACWDSGLAQMGDARLVWVNEGDIIDLGLEVKETKPEGKKK